MGHFGPAGVGHFRPASYGHFNPARVVYYVRRFQYMDTMFQRSVESFNKTLNDFKGSGPVFFDRSFLDALCYAALEGIPVEQEMKTLAETLRYNTNVFILPPWKDIYHTDAQRKQDWNEAVFTYNKMIQTYRGYQYELIEVPKVPIKERADFILHFINNR